MGYDLTCNKLDRFEIWKRSPIFGNVEDNIHHNVLHFLKSTSDKRPSLLPKDMSRTSESLCNVLNSLRRHFCLRNMD